MISWKAITSFASRGGDEEGKILSEEDALPNMCAMTEMQSTCNSGTSSSGIGRLE